MNENVLFIESATHIASIEYKKQQNVFPSSLLQLILSTTHSPAYFFQSELITVGNDVVYKY